ncbi:DUF6355 family natural product biosynthesis protein [Nonomuraea sp. NEAU-A123]|uniref:DUF6355 family natural product biosynthesis protein n=1 Tax=Nonomuraea sp. NEAU-A123 TaxID=2839649 RepID=UPI001BE429D0|nr:DUF6355 family natural product biosynthesis protein [Nonomuraea sp. NEAU-A123]MBT2225453.1 hypothetical protein [Nonomuraea sp. NEAU-A123]
MRRKSAPTVAALVTGATLALSTGTALEGAAHAVARKCVPSDYYTSDNVAYYHHCGHRRGLVMVERVDNTHEWTYCSRPWEDRPLGPADEILWAHVIGRC